MVGYLWSTKLLSRKNFLNVTLHTAVKALLVSLKDLFVIELTIGC